MFQHFMNLPVFLRSGPWFSVAAAGLVMALSLFAGAPAQADELPTFQLVIKGGRLIPESIEVPANTKFRLTIKNEGPGAAEFESVELKKEKVLAAGVISSLVFYPLQPGSYKFFDEFHADTAQGRIVAR
ncbi:MAG TPA: cupredoxin domain-containing protein [Rhodocyclaceae bacterium]|nr:cupredoxin domain-containing protein [Rhodocyclaceae bacterium]